MNTGTMYYDSTLDVRSPLMEEKVRVIRRDEDMNEYISYEPFDSLKYIKSLGTDENWKLKELLKAGINPDFPIHTTAPTKLELVGKLGEFVMAADKLATEIENETTEIENKTIEIENKTTEKSE